MERNTDHDFTADLELLLHESDREDPILPEIRNADQAPEEELNERILAGLVSPWVVGSGLVARSRLTPEGVSAAEQCRLIDALAQRGQTCFTLVYHSPSLAPGHTPYVRDESELRAFLDALERVLLFFRDTLGGRFTTLSEVAETFPRQRGAA